MIYHTEYAGYEIRSLDDSGFPKYSIDTNGVVYGVRKSPLIFTYKNPTTRAVTIRGFIVAIDRLMAAAFHGIQIHERCRTEYLDGDFSNLRLENLRFETKEK